MAIDYESWAETYDSTRGISATVLDPLLLAIGTADGGTVLDIGGGTGSYANALFKRGYFVTLCDPSPGMANQALTKEGSRYSVVADGRSLPFKDAAFDCANAIKVLNHRQRSPIVRRVISHTAR